MSIPADSDLTALAERTGCALVSHHLKLAAAESCTGGWIAKVMTDVAGSSGWFDRGFVTYSNAAKASMLGVCEHTLSSHGAVSEAAAREMVAGALARSEADVACAVTGIAGPSGAVPGKPVGTVWLAWGRRGGRTAARVMHFDGNREAVRRQTVAEALRGVLAMLA